MLFMVIETFKKDHFADIYNRLDKSGRMMPEGVKYIDSWIDAGLNRCFQIVECDNAVLLQEWIANWRDLVKFDVIPVVHSRDTAKAAKMFLHQNDG